MTKCDICGTSIPYGTNRCPNCGYKYKKDKNIGVILPKQENETLISFLNSSETLKDLKKQIDFKQMRDLGKSLRKNVYTNNALNNIKSSLLLTAIILIFIVVFVIGLLS